MFLQNRFAADIRPSWPVQRKLETVARLLGTNNTQRYRNLYLAGNGSLFTWYLGEDTPANNVRTIYNRMTRRHPGILTGLFPRLTEENATPLLHRLYDYGDYIAVEFGSLDATRTYTVNWEPMKVHVDRTYRVVIRNNPFTLEVRASGEHRQTDLIASIGAEIGIENLEETLTKCDLADETRRNQLDTAIHARFCGSDLTCTTDGLSSMKLRAAANERMDGSAEYLEQIVREGREEARRVYEFVTRHGDGYDETSEYTISLESGEVRMAGAASELSIENLRQHVVALY
jgi:hypothetical protein